MIACIVVSIGLGLALFGRVCYSLGYGKGYIESRDHFQDRFINRLKSATQKRDGEPQVFRG